MDTGCSDAESSSSHGVSWSNLTTPCCVQGSRQRHYSRSHDLQNENVLLLVIIQTYGVSSRHDGHSYVCSVGLWFLLRTVCCNCCKRSDTQHSLLCSLCSVSVLQWPQKKEWSDSTLNNHIIHDYSYILLTIHLIYCVLKL